MGLVVCATRGGAGSRAVQHKAALHARDTGNKLVFLYVIDTTRMDARDESLKPAVQAELYWMGRALLRIAQQRAEMLGITSEIVIREGAIRDEICQFLEDKAAELVFLGAPRGTSTTRFGDDSVEQFAQMIQHQSGVPVEVVRPEDVDGDGPWAGS